MFGLFRLVLALMVMLGHLFWISDFGRYAVFGFFVLSGYLMTLIMHETYGYSAGGVKNFAVNRFLRLYPGYWFACLVSLAVILLAGESQTSRLHGSLSVPETPGMVLVNLTMMSWSLFPNEVEPRLSPATWALTVELFYYALIALGLSATRQRTVIWVTVSFLYLLLTYVMGLYWHARYFALPAGSLPFSIGAYLYFLKREGWSPQLFQWKAVNPALLLTVIVINAVLGSLVQQQEGLVVVAELFFYVNLVICTLLIYSLALGNRIVTLSRRLDKQLGDYSYPVYLLHWQIGALALFLLQGRVEPAKFQFLPSLWLVSLALVFLVSYLLIRYIDRPVELVRNRVRLRSQPAPAVQKQAT